jgi:ABC-type branched-subunit amino acid transport system substrate-binding protein
MPIFNTPARKIAAFGFRPLAVIIASAVFGATVSGCASTSPAPIYGPSGQNQGPQGPVIAAPNPLPEIANPQPAGPANETGVSQEVKSPAGPAPEVSAPSPQAEAPPYIEQGDRLTPPHMRGRRLKRLGLLLPFSAKSSRLREEASSMLKAAELAVFDRDAADVVLVTLDTQGTARGAKAAAQTAMKAGVDVILGPVLSGSVKSAASAARSSGVPVVAFSTDQTAAGRGTYLLSFPPEAEVERIVEYAASTGVGRFAFFGPESAYGRRVNSAYQDTVSRMGGEITVSESYRGDDISVMQGPAKRIAQQFEAQDVATNGAGPMAFEAIILPEGGTPLRSLAPLLPYFYDGLAEVQFMGTGLWQREETVREPALNNGIFAGPDEGPRKNFQMHYDRSYGEDPSRLASLAYDAINVGAVIADGDPRARIARAEDPAGFYGADGFVRFNSDGTPDRGLAVYQIRDGKFRIIDPAPKSAAQAGPS